MPFDDRYDCQACQDRYHVTAPPDPNHPGYEFTIPCEHCNRKAWELWRDGHYKAGHSCEECQPTRRRKVKAGWN